VEMEAERAEREAARTTKVITAEAAERISQIDNALFSYNMTDMLSAKDFEAIRKLEAERAALAGQVA